MFVDYKVKASEDWVSYDPDTNEHSYQVKIIDDDFEECVIGRGIPNCSEVQGCKDCAWIGALFDAIVQVYQARNLNIAKNLFLSILKLDEVYRDKNKIFTWYKDDYARSELYEQEIKKYLLFV
jgi:hypothetical protein